MKEKDECPESVKTSFRGMYKDYGRARQWRGQQGEKPHRLNPKRS